MFIGHFAVAFAAKKAAPTVSLGTLMLAAQFVDMLWPVFLLLGFEHVRIAPGITAFTPFDFYDYPISHSLLTGMEWGLVFGGAYYSFRSKDIRAAWILAGCVVSHWFLDVASHRPDMPIFPWSDVKVGLGLWNSVPATLAVELSLFATGVFVYLRSTTTTNQQGVWGMWGFIGFALVAYAAAAFGPPPPNVPTLAWSAQAAWLLTAWVYWFDKQRTPVAEKKSA